jgi:imidazolonepropionase-like amidohydrolase
MRALFVGASALVLVCAALGQPKPAAPTAATPASVLSHAFLIRHGQVHTVGALGTIANGDVLIAGGRIAAVGTNLSAPQGATIIDAQGKPITPGLMASYTQLGIEEIDLVREANDSANDPTIDNAAFDASDAINPNSTLIPVARIRGVTRAITAPALGKGVFFGQAAVIHLGDSPDLVIKRQAGILATLGPVAGNQDRATRADTWAQFRETLDDAREYWAQRGGYHRPGGSRDQRSNRIDLDALGPVIKGAEPLIVHAERASDIRAAVQYATTNHIRIILLGAEEGWEVAEELARAHVPVILDSEHNLPTYFADIGATLKNAARLDRAGVLVTFMPQSDDPAQYARTITQIAGNAVANGMPWDHALAAITKNPAMVWGISSSYGTLDVGKDADVVLWDGDPLEVTSAPTAVFIRGERVAMISRQTKLRDRYRDLQHKYPPFGYR